jgi:hypothetical protein
VRRPVGPRAVKKAIAIVEDSRASHVRILEDPETDMLGTPSFHRRCVKEYDQVLRVLRRIQLQLEE